MQINESMRDLTAKQFECTEWCNNQSVFYAKKRRSNISRF